jgi:hypothetical protein
VGVHDVLHERPVGVRDVPIQLHEGVLRGALHLCETVHRSLLQALHGTLHVPEELHPKMLCTLHKVRQVFVRPLHEVRQVFERPLHEVRRVFELLQHRMWPALPQTTWMRLYLPVYRLWGWPDSPLLLLQLRVGSLHQDAERGAAVLVELEGGGT